MDVTQTQATQLNTATPAPAAAEEPALATNISADFETYLTLLTTQLENQDPLNPMESQEFAVQLATFSGVEQQVQTNDLLKDLADAMGAPRMSELAGWVGMDARVNVPITFDGAPVRLAPEMADNADFGVLVVRDLDGNELSRDVVAPEDVDSLTWVGIDGDGNVLPNGTYDIQMESYVSGNVVASTPVQFIANIREARLDNGSVELVLNNGLGVSADQISALRGTAF